MSPAPDGPARAPRTARPGPRSPAPPAAGSVPPSAAYAPPAARSARGGRGVLQPRDRAATVVVVLAVLVAIVGVPMATLDRLAGTRDRVGDRAVRVLQDDTVRDRLAAVIGEQAAERAPSAFRSQVAPAAERIAGRVLAGRRVRVAWRTSVRRAYDDAVDPDRRQVRVLLSPFVDQLADAAADRGLPPEATSLLSGVGEVATVRLKRTSGEARSLSRLADTARAGPAILAVAIGLLVLALLLARRRGRTLMQAGFGLVVVGVLGAAAALAVRGLALGGVPGADRDAVGVAWDVVLGPLVTVPVVVLAAGPVVAIAGRLLDGRARRG